MISAIFEQPKTDNVPYEKSAKQLLVLFISLLKSSSLETALIHGRKCINLFFDVSVYIF